MKIIHRVGTKYVLRFDRGEEVMGGLRKFCESIRIKGGFFSGIGAAQEVILSSYDLEEKIYHDETGRGELEIAGIIGNVARLGDETIIHAHGTFSDPKMKVYAGHIKKLVVYATCEIVLEAFKRKIERQFNKEIGLNLLK